ncbi:MAG: hypothetical protein ACOCTI_04090, partial [Phycisphaeraceae bacterium]
MLKLATLIDNPGEPPVETRYRDPQQLKQLGYNAMAIYETTALSGLESADVIASSELRRWVAGQIDHIGRRIDAATAAGLKVYFFYDVLVLPEDVVQRNAARLTCRNRPTTLCPGSDQAIALSVAALKSILTRWPQVEGVALRFGDTDAPRLLHLVGNDIYAPHCPRCSNLDKTDRIARILERFYDLVVRQMDKRLIARAWNVRPNGLHDSAELARRVAAQLPGPEDDDRLMLSFKFTQTDFWRYQKWNPSSLVFGKRSILYELQCQREFEGKGGIPNWQAPLWRDGYPETREQSDVHGLAEAAERVNLAGLWAWVRGGGWGGPFLKNETWVDANVMAAARLADDPGAEPEALAKEWIQERLAVRDPAAHWVLTEILEQSPEMVRQAFYIGPAARSRPTAWHPSDDWIQDDVLDARAAWRIIQRLPESQLDEVVREKELAAAQAARGRAQLQHLLGDQPAPTLDAMANTLLYAESFFEVLRDLLAGLVAYRRYLKHKTPGTAEVARQKL